MEVSVSAMFIDIAHQGSRKEKVDTMAQVRVEDRGVEFLYLSTVSLPRQNAKRQEKR
jgi:hypothetical protein